MRHLLAFIVILTLVAILYWLAEHPGELILQWQDYYVESSMFGLVALALGIVFTTYIVIALIHVVTQAPDDVRQRVRRKREQKGLMALGESMAALALQDIEKAQYMAARSRALLDNHPTTLLLAAQVANRKGSFKERKRLFKELQQHEPMRAVAAQGLWQMAIQDSEWPTAINNAEIALKHSPNKFLLKQLYGLYLRQRQWADADRVLRKFGKKAGIGGSTRKHLKAVYYYVKSQHSDSMESRDQALQQSVKTSPSFLPAVTAHVRRLLELGDKRGASKLIRQAWKEQPHPALKPLWLEALADLDEKKRMAQCETLAKQQAPEHIAAALWLTELAIVKSDFSHARNYAKQALQLRDDIRAYELLIAIEEATDHPQQAESWQRKSVNALAAPDWQCTHCGYKPVEWEAFCSQCHYFDTAEWKLPDSLLPAPTS